MRVQIPGETRRDYRYVLGLTLPQIMSLLIGGALALLVKESQWDATVQWILWVLIAVVAVLFSFVRWPLRGGEPFAVWVMRWLHFIGLNKRFVYGEVKRPHVAHPVKAPAPVTQIGAIPIAIPIHPFSGPIRIAQGKKPLVTEFGGIKLYFSRKGRDVFVTMERVEE